MKKFILSLISLPLIGIAILFLLPRPSFEIEAPRPHFWDYPKVSEAKYHTEINAEGKLVIELEHPILKGVTPEMISWWYRNLASGKATIQGKEYEFYHLFHLSEHGQTRVIEPATDGSNGMGVGALVYRQEKFGPFLSKGMGRVLSFDSNGFTVSPVLGPLSFGTIEHHFEPKEDGTLYRVKTILGSDAPVIGRILSLYIRTKQFPPEVVQEWIRHQVEEVGSLSHFLPELFHEQVKTASHGNE
jgi:hypothetical protein